MYKFFSPSSRNLVALAALMLSSGLAAQDYFVPAGTASYIRSAVESTDRDESATARDVNRLPAEVLSLAGTSLKK